ncbi:MAG: 5'/3'-nucleotidase SurE [Spirulinaceae cyanobacterium RM2_2_10]|nr:5'/3'-nucleotidase SurE [Spirulinaceae cyanobacterium SM2_1_0]NJO19230.1 5'/3'-nucleotidase SurE [Spirulinaceae cyanobacterium RM2_2_10]
MVFILTNDDGIDAPGLRALEQAVQTLNQPSAIVAPAGEFSGCGHQTTTQQPLPVECHSERAYAVSGTPADCTRLALHALYPQQIDWLLSGVNAGGNLGVDIYTSGTVAAAREAAMHGIPAIAISHFVARPLTIDWEQAAQWTHAVLEKLLSLTLPPAAFWNVNLPHLESGAMQPPIIFCEASTQPLPVVYRQAGNAYVYTGVYAERQRAPGTDIDICFQGHIAVTQLRV